MSAERLTANQQELVTKYIPLVKHVIKVMKRTNHPAARLMEYDDAMSAGYIGLCKAAIFFDENYGVKFITYAFMGIRNTIIRYSRYSQAITLPSALFDETQTRMDRIPGGKFYQTVAASQIKGRDEDFDPLAIVSNRGEEQEQDVIDARHDCEILTKELNVKYKKVLTTFFRHNSLTKTGQELDLSPERIRQINVAALDQIRRKHKITVES
jgi:RNA polymerase sigma factor (sigma-70 family)